MEQKDKFVKKRIGRRGSISDITTKKLDRRSSAGYMMSPVVEWNIRDFSKLYECVKLLGRGAQGSVLSLRSKHYGQSANRPVVAKFYKETPTMLDAVTNEITILKELNKDGCKPFLLCYQENFRCFGSSIPSTACSINVNATDTYLVVVYDYFLGKGTTSLQNLISHTILPDTEVQQAPNPSVNYEETDDYYDEKGSFEEYEAEYLEDLLQDIVDGQDEEEDDQNYEEDDEEKMEKEDEIELTAELILKILYTLVKAVSYLHSHGVAHLDLKPDNVIINLEKGRVQLIDFGLSCMQKVCSPSGTPDYLAPEIAKVIGSRYKKITLEEAMLADSWSIGVMLYQLVNKENPFNFSNGDKIYFLGAKLDQKKIKHSAYTDPGVHQSISDKINIIIDGFLRVSKEERLSVALFL